MASNERRRQNREAMQRLRERRFAEGLNSQGTTRKSAGSLAGTPPVMRVLERVVIGDGCWTYPSLNRPMIEVDGTTQLAYRAVYEELVGPIPIGFTIDHLCQNRRCVNPDHMESVTRGENTRRYYRSKRAA